MQGKFGAGLIGSLILLVLPALRGQPPTPAPKAPTSTPAPKAATSPTVFETKVAALINRDVITDSEVWRALRGAAAGTLGERRQQMFQDQLLDILEEKLFAQAGEQVQLVINEGAVQQLIEDRKEAAGGVEAFNQTLRDSGLSLGEYQASLAKDYQRSVIERIRAGEIRGLGDVLRADHVVEPTLEEIRRYYKAYQDQKFRIGAAAEVETMMFSKAQLRESPTQAQEVAVAARQEVLTGADWATVAKRLSSDPRDKAMGGQHESVVLSDSELAPEIIKYAETGPIGEISEPIDFGRGFFLVRVKSRKDARTIPFLEAQALVRDLLKQENIRRARAEVQMNLLKEAFIQPPELKEVLMQRVLRKLQGLRS